MSYLLEVSPNVQLELKRLPGNVRQRLRQAIKDLASNPRPSESRELDFDLTAGEPRRLRLGQWRVIYAIVETDTKYVAVLAIYRRPPYQYDDLTSLFTDLT